MSIQLINSSERCVDDMLEGIVAANPGLVLFPEQRMVVERSRLIPGNSRRKKVALVTGGGSGHEPFSAGYVGVGMLASTTAGPIFTSPPPGAITSAITAVGRDNPEGVMLIVFNYTGDRVNFGLALERCRAAGMKVEMYVSGDDAALTHLAGTAGRRGLCGTHFIFKIAGAMAEDGASLEEVLATCKRLGQSMGTIGVAASGCTLPGNTSPLFSVEKGCLELGLGVHGETGAATLKAESAAEVVKSLLSQLTREDSETRLDLRSGDKVAVIVNNLGTISQIEMNILVMEIVKQLKGRGVTPVRVYQGPIMTSLDMKGFHMAVLRLLDPRWVQFLDAPTTAPAWPTPCLIKGDNEGDITPPDLSWDIGKEMQGTSYRLSADDAKTMHRCLEVAVKEVPQYEAHLNDLDTGCGDGDCGSTLVLGILELSKQLPELAVNYPSRVLATVGEIASCHMGGSSGGLYSILFTAAAAQMAPLEVDTHRNMWARALRAGVDAVSKYGGASKGDRTMLDALVPAVEVLESSLKTKDLSSLLSAMATAADEGAKQTAHMKARAGRASYVRQENVKGEDAGARAVACVLRALAHYQS